MDRPRKASEIDEDRFSPEDVTEMNSRFARIMGEHERIGEGFRNAEREALFGWSEDWDDGYL